MSDKSKYTDYSGIIGGMSNPTKLNGQFSTSSLSNSIHNLQRLADKENAYVELIYDSGEWGISFAPIKKYFYTVYEESGDLKTTIEKVMTRWYKENGKEKKA